MFKLSKRNRIMIITVILLFASLACGLGNDNNENDEYQYQNQQMPTATYTPLPPKPTSTPFPSPTTLPGSQDEKGDAKNCRTEQLVNHPPGDIDWIDVSLAQNVFIFRVKMMEALTGDQSLALYLSLASSEMATEEPGGGERKVKIDVNASSLGGGFLNSYTGEVDPSDVTIDYDQATGLITTQISNSLIAKGVTRVSLETYLEDSETVCDTTAEFSFSNQTP